MWKSSKTILFIENLVLHILVAMIFQGQVLCTIYFFIQNTIQIYKVLFLVKRKIKLAFLNSSYYIYPFSLHVQETFTMVFPENFIFKDIHSSKNPFYIMYQNINTKTCNPVTCTLFPWKLTNFKYLSCPCIVNILWIVSWHNLQV